ncbi:hypothetical protein GOM49_13815 [Clostridium bovifaecis]|uniref:HTH marR-type domain-containing protein n=1 Tax=Clostridium bovifaecis TaxID=2184719 RepID=A0A6I6FDR9_9CLOT|nr:hypothetical protein GOM49_13815 [Clostridium bovifaecis]
MNIDILERKNFIERHPSEKDRRSFVIHITEAGLNITKEVIQFLDGLFNNLLKDIPYEKLKIYNEVLLQIDENIDNL